MSDFFIYGLADPRSGAIRYVGQTSVGMARPKSHYAGQGGDKKGRWVNGLRRQGLRFKIRILEELDGPELLDVVESFWVKQALGVGWRILNCLSVLPRHPVPACLSDVRWHLWGQRAKRKAKAEFGGQSYPPLLNGVADYAGRYWHGKRLGSDDFEWLRPTWTKSRGVTP